MRRCTRKQTVLDRYGRPVTRCAAFSGNSGRTRSGRRRGGRRRGGLFGFGQDIALTGRKGGLLVNFQPVLVTGGLAAVGAWASQSLAAKIGKSLNVRAGSGSEALLTILLGVVLGGIVGRITKKSSFGVALGVGAVAVTGLQFIGSLSRQSGYGSWGVLTAEPAPYYQPVALPPIASFPTVSNLYTDAGAVVAA